MIAVIATMGRAVISTFDISEGLPEASAMMLFARGKAMTTTPMSATTRNRLEYRMPPTSRRPRPCRSSRPTKVGSKV